MANIMVYKTDFLRPHHHRIFDGVYNDFYKKAFSEYNFELKPLTCEEFCQAVQDGLLQCIILTEDEIPTAFLVATTVISDAIELNRYLFMILLLIIHLWDLDHIHCLQTDHFGMQAIDYRMESAATNRYDQDHGIF